MTTNNNFAQFINSSLFVLGAADPEMNCIEGALRTLGCDVVFAAYRSKDGAPTRVHPGNAYKATDLIGVTKEGYPNEVITVECGMTEEVEYDFFRESDFIEVDHHNPGDVGYGLPPEKFWEGSSVGQVWNLLLGYGCPEEALAQAFGPDVRLVAAGDHCPSHAYRGRCPGIDVEALKRLRARNSAAYNRQTPEEWLSTLEAACAALRALPRSVLAGSEYAVATEEIKLLNEASLVEAIPVEYSMAGTPRDPRPKVGLLGGEPTLVAAWMEAKEGLLTGIYGDPQRGYAGGYLPS